LDFLKRTTEDGHTIQAFLYDAQGKPISGLTQTTVGGVAGIFYMSFKISASNIGNVELTDLRMQESHPTEFTSALQNALPIQPILTTTDDNILEWDTANSCSTDANCGASERCIDNLCLIDISNFLGEITFGTTLEADFLDAQGNPQTTSNLINLPIVFEQDAVVLRFEKLSSAPIGDFKNSWIAFDSDNDGVLEGYGGDSSTVIGQDCKAENSEDPDFIAFYGDYIIARSALVIQVCDINSGINNDDIIVFRDTDDDAQRAILLNIPLEPYKSEDCGGLLPCKEIYSIAVGQPDQICGNDLIEGTELCDGTDLGIDDCTTIGQGFTGGTLACGGNCDAWDTSGCTGAPIEDYVIFRTQTLTYDSGTAIAYDRVGTSCTLGTALTKYGHETKLNIFLSSHANCDAYFINPSLMELPGDASFEYIPIGSPKLYLDDSDVDEIWVCQDVSHGTLSAQAVRYDTDDCPGDCGSLSDSSESIDSNFEVPC